MPLAPPLMVAAVAVLLTTLLTVLTGCMTHTVATDFKRAELMPEPAAKTVVAKYVPGYSGGSDLYLGGRAMPIRTVKTMTHYRDGKLVIQGGGDDTALCDVSIGAATELAEALTALGASINLGRTDDINPWILCRATVGK